MRHFIAIFFTASLFALPGCDDLRAHGAGYQADGPLVNEGRTVPPCPPEVCGENTEWR